MIVKHVEDSYSRGGEVWVFLNEDDASWRVGHKIWIDKIDLEGGELVPARARIRLLSFDGKVDDLPIYIESLHEVQRQAQALEAAALAAFPERKAAIEATINS